MRLHRIRIANFRGVDEHEVVFSANGVTVVEGDNEVGKSSLAEALDLLLEVRDNSTKQAVRDVQPAGRDVGAEVEVELSTGPYRLRYAKRFHRDRFTELRIDAPAPEHLRGRQAHERVARILAETMDVPLWKALRLQQGVSLDQADLSEQTSLSAALDSACGSALGGQREHGVYERVRAEYERYFTATGRPNAEQQRVVAAHEDLARAAADLREQMAGLEADVVRCARLEQEIAQRGPREAEQRRRAAALEQRVRALQAEAGRVRQLDLEAEVAVGRRTAAERAVAQRAELVAAVDAARATCVELAETEERLAPTLAVAEKSLRAARDRLDTARRERSDHAHSVDAAERDLDHFRDTRALADLQARLERVHRAQADAARAASVVETCRIDDALLARIEQAHLDAALARATLEGDGPRVRVEALAQAHLDVDGDRRALHAGDNQEHAVAEAMCLTVPGALRIEITAGAGIHQLRARRDEADEHLARLCERAGVADVAEARTRNAERAQAERLRVEAADALRSDLADATPELLESTLARLRERVAGGDRARGTQQSQTQQPANSLEDAEATAAAARARRDVADEEVRETQAEVAAAEAAHTEARDAAIQRAVRREEAEQRAAAADSQLAAARAEMDDAGLAAAVETARAEAAQALAEAQAAHAALPAGETAEVTAQWENAVAVAEREARALRDLHNQLTDVRARLEVRGEDGLHRRLEEAEADLLHVERQRRSLEARAEAARLLHDTFTRHRDAARRAYVGPFQERLRSLGRIVFGETFDVDVDETLRITTRTLGGTCLDYGQLSAGAREQLAVIARLACAALVAEDGGVPVILDDALGWSDPARLEKLGAVFAVAARSSQVIVLTCLPERYRQIGTANVVRLPAPVHAA